MGRGGWGLVAGTASVPDLMVLLMAGVAIDLSCAELWADDMAGSTSLPLMLFVIEGEVPGF